MKSKRTAGFAGAYRDTPLRLSSPTQRGDRAKTGQSKPRRQEGVGGCCRGALRCTPMRFRFGVQAGNRSRPHPRPLSNRGWRGVKSKRTAGFAGAYRDTPLRLSGPTQRGDRAKTGRSKPRRQEGVGGCCRGALRCTPMRFRFGVRAGNRSRPHPRPLSNRGWRGVTSKRTAGFAGAYRDTPLRLSGPT